ncbi:hypothetical protein ACH5RR_023858 [Cinchona calisaya]|uniref:Scarecrow-like protein 6 n=1 Tax=Cinchona calisaya TaxID=153742 RepID=A0ABD2ZDQ1_9GENT
MPLPFNFEGKGMLLDLLDLQVFINNSSTSRNCKASSSSDSEPKSVLDNIRSQSPPTSSSSLGGGGCGGARSNVAIESELQFLPPSLEKCTMEEWESVLPESAAASPSQEQSILRWLMRDVDDPSMVNLNKALQIGGGSGGPPAGNNYEINSGFGIVDNGFGGGPVGLMTNSTLTLNPSMPMSSSASLSGHNSYGEKVASLANSPGNLATNSQNSSFPSLPSYLGGPFDFNQGQQRPPTTTFDEMKPPIFNPQMLINQHQAQHPQNPSFFMPCGQQEQDLLMPSQAKRHNPGPIGGTDLSCHIPKTPFSIGPKQKMIIGNQMGNYHQQQQEQAIMDQLYKAAELIQIGNPLLAEGVLARLNHQLTPINKPFYRAAFYCKEALQLLLQNNNNLSPRMANSSPVSLIFKVGAYKSFSEISPIVQFANFACIQALLEVLEEFDHIHIVDFDIGYGGQWASFMQELALRSCGAPSLRITAFASPSTHDHLELGLIRENLVHFASGINMAFEFDIVSIDSLNSGSWSLPLKVSENEAIAVNLPVSSFSSCQLSLTHILRFVKLLSPKIVVSIDRGCDRTDLPFPNLVIHALQSYSNLLESLDAVNVNLDSLQKIERFLLQPRIERILSSRYRSPEKSQHWRTMFLSSGFSPLIFSNFTESQAECLVKRIPVRGFQVEKRQSSLVLCWQRKELISASAWRC